MIHTMARMAAISRTTKHMPSRHPHGQEIPQKPRGPTRLEYTRRKMLTANQAAAILGVHPSMVRRLCAEGYLKATHFGKAWMIKPEDLKKYVPRTSGGQIKGERIKAASVTRRKYARND